VAVSVVVGCVVSAATLLSSQPLRGWFIHHTLAVLHLAGEDNAMLIKFCPRLISVLMLIVLFIPDSEIPSLPEGEAASTQNGPCVISGYDACADIGNPADEAFHYLTGWGANERGGPVIPPSGDPSKRYQPLRGESSVKLEVSQLNIPYTLYTEVEDGGCDDSWAIYINGQGPIYTYYARPLIDTGLAHQVVIPASYFQDTTITITFRNLASDNCGLAAVFYVKLQSASVTHCQLNGVSVFYQGWPSTPDVLPNRPEWYNHVYGNYPDGDTYNIVGRWGCNTTSNAMIINYYAQQSGLPHWTDPGLLNSWLRTNSGYNAEHGVIYGKVAEYAWKQGEIKLTLTGIGSPDSQRLDAHLCSGHPAMLRVTTSYGSHFVVAVGKTTINGTDTYLLHDPIWGQTTLLEQYGGIYQAAYYYQGGNSVVNRSMLEVSAHSPVHLLVTDPLGRKTGYDPRSGEIWKEVPNADYLTESINEPDGNSLAGSKLLLIYQPIAGSYSVQIIGYSSGSFTVDVIQTDVLGNTKAESFTGSAQTDSVDNREVNFSPGGVVYLPLIMQAR
jgi:hypothetical protein